VDCATHDQHAERQRNGPLEEDGGKGEAERPEARNI
jgi:hypothetical protein